MAKCNNANKEEINDDLRGELVEVHSCEQVHEEWWTMKFDGTPSTTRGGAGVVISKAEKKLAAYKDMALSLMGRLKEWEISHAPRVENKHVDALATIGSKEERGQEGFIFSFKRIQIPSSNVLFKEEIPSDWRKPIINQLKAKIFNKAVKDYQEINAKDRRVLAIHEDTLEWLLPPTPIEADKLHKKAPRYFLKDGELFKERILGEVLRCLGRDEKEKVMGEIHGGVCDRHQGGKSLWIELLRVGYYWLNMKEAAMHFARCCKQCQKHDNLIHSSAASMHDIVSPYPFYT
ncbi:hypothetical protein SESBI_09053 [Sesbania bispinosa]|nr:hypothetical protein SESBI_09053 [Sesbania bispinosa]